MSQNLKLSGSDLACIRGGRTIFSGLDFTLGSGEGLLLTGRNGAGKSSLLRMIAGLIRLGAGRLELAGGAGEREIPEQAHYLGHLDALKPSLSVLENLGFWASYLEGAGKAQNAPEKNAPEKNALEKNALEKGALEKVGLGALAALPAGYLSAGQKRRLSLARLIAVERPLWLLDEPTAALDVAGQAMLLGLMQAHLAKGGLIIAATHQPIDIKPVRELRLGAPA